jgi:glycosyltransferase involved in cell wall biosynthesis
LERKASKVASKVASEDTAEVTIVLSQIIATERPRQAVLTVDVAIPAFNEGSCIGDLLDDVVTAKGDDRFQIQHIYVISDSSTDQTDDIVQQFASRDQRVQLIRKQERKGKQDSINLAFTVTNADILVLIDADVRLASERSILKLVQHFRDCKTALVQGGLVRVRPSLSLNLAKQAGYFDCTQQRSKFIWAEDAIFNYGPSVSIADFSHQWSRYFFYTEQSRYYFGKGLIANDMSVPALRRTIISSIIRHPYSGLVWILCYGIGRVEFMRRVNFKEYESGFFWTKSAPLMIEASERLRPEGVIG